MTSHVNAENSYGIIRGWKGIMQIVPRSRAQLWRDIRNGRFPEPLELSANSIGWLRSEIENWLATRPRRHYSATEPTPCTDRCYGESLPEASGSKGVPDAD